MEIGIDINRRNIHLQLGDVVVAHGGNGYIVMKDYEECMKSKIRSDDPNPYVALRSFDGTHGMSGTKLLSDFEKHINQRGYEHYSREDFMLKLVLKEDNN